MSEADVQLFQSWAEGLAAADDPLEFMYENMWAENIDHRAVEGAIDDRGPIIGRDAMRAYLADWQETFPGVTWVIDEVLDAGPGLVIAVIHQAVTARGSDVPVDIRVSILYAIRDGKIVRGREYPTMDEALRAASLKE